MDNFNLKKFLTENKLTKTSVLREGVGAYEYEKGKAEGKAEEKKKMTKEEFKQKIKEMIIAELDGAAVTDEDYDFVAEGSDDEDYEKAGREVEYGMNPNDEKFDLKDFFMDDEMIDDKEELAPEIPGFEGTRDALDDLSIREAKKKNKEEVPAEEAPEEEVDATLDMTDTGEDFNVDTSAVDPNIKAVQDALTQAQAAAKSINDDKLTQQIGNTITMFTRTHIANTEPIAEGKLTDGLTPEEKKIYDKVKNTITYKGMEKYDSKEYSKKLQKALQAAAMHNEESER
jgi:hypothetical protein